MTTSITSSDSSCVSPSSSNFTSSTYADVNHGPYFYNLSDLVSPSPPGEDILAGVVSGFYGPGAVGGWLLSSASFLLSLLYPDKATHDALNNDFLVSILYPAIASGDLIVQSTTATTIQLDISLWNFYAEWRKAGHSGTPGPFNEWVQQPGRHRVFGVPHAVPGGEIPLGFWALKYTTFASLAIIRISLVVFSTFFILSALLSPNPQNTRRRTIITLCVMGFSIISPLVCLTSSWRTYVDFLDLAQTHDGRQPKESKSVLIWFKYRLGTRGIIFSDFGIVIVLVLVTIFLSRWKRPMWFMSSFILLVSVCLANILFGFRGSRIGQESLTLSWDPSLGYNWPSFIMANPLFPHTATRLGDLDQAVALAAGGASVLFSLRDLMLARGYYPTLSRAVIFDKAKRNIQRFNQGGVNCLGKAQTRLKRLFTRS
ncbi:hypothetical protein N7499_007552 [Penicillium canescens]|nr:hypothetical protein N7499_007552 [Penicillium canescens]KAJ6175524.1 hypothetical protein N7485_002438 [Penicillium canescens]